MTIGDVWGSIDNPTGDLYTVKRLSSDRLVAVGNNAAAYSDDSGTSWTEATLPSGANLSSLKGLIELQSGRLLAGNTDFGGDYFVLRSEDSGATWEGIEITSGYAIPFCDFVQTASGRIVGVAYEGGWHRPDDNFIYPTIGLSDDEGLTWDYRGNTDEQEEWRGCVLMASGRILISGWNQTTNAGVAYSDDEGDNWDYANAVFDSNGPFDGSHSGPLYDDLSGRVFILGSWVVCSEDEGDSWFEITGSALDDYSWVEGQGCAAGPYLFIAIAGLAVIRSGDAGDTWETVYGSDNSIGDLYPASSGYPSEDSIIPIPEEDRLIVVTGDSSNNLMSDGSFAEPPPEFWTDHVGTREIRRA